ncbi:MAG: biopolymer transporter ExbD [Prevotella sp.]|nr:biopolymer transporter ExbD [Prevotella sp.]
MKLRKRQTGYFGLNTTSTADISFMLLVFFLVTTSMYVDKGFIRRLPPKDKDEKQRNEMVVDKENIMALGLDAAGQLSVNDTLADIRLLRGQLQTFILSRKDKHLITIDADNDCPYEAYYAVQNALTEAYRGARETTAEKEYGRAMSRLTDEERTAVLARLPHRVAENYHEEDAQ